MMRWTQMNFRHSGWQTGYRYFTRWNRGLGWQGALGPLRQHLEQQHGPAFIPIEGPPSREQLENSWVMAWGLGRYPNPAWSLDPAKKRLYVTQETLLWARLQGQAD
jgi:hypothetical protein